MKQKVWLAIIQGVLIAIVFWVILWYGYSWLPDIQSEIVQSLLIGIIQTQAGIWAIAISFSLLYVQISVDAYSLRAARLLFKYKSFQQMTGYYVLSLVLNSLLVLFMNEGVKFMPSMAGIVGVGLFLYGLVVMVDYITRVVDYITPENIIDTLRQQMDRNQIEKEALQTTIYRNSRTNSVEIRIPLDFVRGVELRILTDITKRMANRLDHIAVKAAIDGIVGLNPTGSMVMSLEEYHELLTVDQGTEEQIDAKRRRLRERAIRKELTAAAMLAYRSGALVEIWAAAIQSQDRITAALLVDGMGQMLSSDILPNSIRRTKVLETVIYGRMFKETSQYGWFDLREQVIRLITDGLERMGWENPSVDNEYVAEVIYLLSQMGHVLLEQEDRVDNAERSIFRAISLLGRYGASVCDDELVLSTCRYLHYRVTSIRSQLWRSHILYQERAMANIVEEIGCLWVEKKPIRDHVDRTFYELVVKASVQIVKALNDFEDQNTYPSGANFNYLDTLARIAKACIVAEQWPRAEFVLSQMNELVTDSRETPAYAAVCLSQVLPTAVQSLPLQAVVLWIAAVNQFLDHNASAVSESGLGRLLNQARNANHNEEIVSSSELRTSLDDLIQRLTKKQI